MLLDDAELEALYAEFAEEDMELAVLGLEKYADSLVREEDGWGSGFIESEKLSK